MPHRTSTASATGLPPVPVAVLLPPPAFHPHDNSTAGDLTDWCGVAPRDAAGLIAHYTRPGDLVFELDGHPTITRAARHLGRQPVPPTAASDAISRPMSASGQPLSLVQGAGLIFV